MQGINILRDHPLFVNQYFWHMRKKWFKPVQTGFINH